MARSFVCGSFVCVRFCMCFRTTPTVEVRYELELELIYELELELIYELVLELIHKLVLELIHTHPIQHLFGKAKITYFGNLSLISQSIKLT